jgi:hypothetical protein
MPNAVLEALESQRAEQISTIDAVLGQVEGRDLVDAERSLLEAARQRIGQLDDQLKPLREFEALRAAHTDAASQLPARLPAQPRRVDGPDGRAAHGSPGAYMVDYLRAHGIMERGVRDEAAMARLAQTRAVANQTTGDTAGLLPTPIIGPVVNIIDARRPFLTSLGGTKAMGATPGATFNRPLITQHALVGQQVPAGPTGEKTQLPSQKMTIGNVAFSKVTYGGTVDISRQDIDWTSPGAWDILLQDLANEYALQTEGAVATSFAGAAAGTTVTIGAAGTPPSLAQWATGIYTAAMHSYQAGKRMPTRIWCSLDVWAALGALVDTTRVVLPVDTTREMGAPGTSNLGDFSGDLFGLPRIVVPTFASGTMVIGPDDLFEAYEEVIGLLSVVEPSILGVQVAYGGYLAWGMLLATAYVKLTIAGTLPTIALTDEPPAGEPEAEAEQPPAAHAGRGK